VESAPEQPGGPPDAYEGPLVAVAGYGMLFLFGLLQGLIGAFQYTRSIGPVPAAALLFDVAIGVTCVLGAWGMGRPLGGLVPALGWFLAVLVLDMATAGGSVVIANLVPGTWFLLGGAACAVAGVLIAFLRSPARKNRR
jgi:Family of unknown function (DUF6113)